MAESRPRESFPVAVVSQVGERALGIARDTGGIAILFGQVVRALVPPRLHGRELVRHLHWMANRSIPIVALTAFFTGGLMVMQSALFVRRFNAYGIMGWGAGYAILREIGPVLIALMFSGRVGANNTAELGTMTVTEQLDGLRALAIDPIRYLIVPRVTAMVIGLFILTLMGDIIALYGGTLFALLVQDVEYSTLYYSMVDNLTPADLIHGLVKSAAFGLSIALTSCYFGITVRGGAVGVGRAVNAAVVAAATSILVIDFLLTYLLP